jgi:hypothetical protein
MTNIGFEAFSNIVANLKAFYEGLFGNSNYQTLDNKGILVNPPDIVPGRAVNRQ